MGVRGRPPSLVNQALNPLLDAIADYDTAEPAVLTLARAGHPGAFTALRHLREARAHGRAANQALDQLRPRAA